MSHLRDLFVTDNIGAVSARGHSGDIAAITHMGKKTCIGLNEIDDLQMGFGQLVDT